MLKLKVGLVGTIMPFYQVESSNIFNKSIEQVKKFIEENDADCHIVKKQIYNLEDAVAACKELNSNGVDFLLLQISSIDDRDIILGLKDFKGRIGLWAVPEVRQDKMIPQCSLIGANLMGSLIYKYLKGLKLKYKWFYGNVEDDLFRNRMKITLKSLKALKNLNLAKIGVFEYPPENFRELNPDERKLFAIFGTILYRNLNYCDLKQRMDNIKESVIIEEKNKMIKGMKVEIEDEKIFNVARVTVAFKDLIKELDLDAIAIGCRPRLMDNNIAICTTVGDLNENGITAGCESDIMGTFSMLLLDFLASRKHPSTLLDLATFDNIDDTIQFFHCGPTAKSWANASGARLKAHPIVGDGLLGCANDFVFRKAPSTLLRVSDSGDSMFFLSCESLDLDKKSFNGSRGWFGNFKFSGKKVPVIDIMNSILCNGIEHHYAITLNTYEEELFEISNWLDLKVVSPLEYKNSFQKSQF